MCQQYKTEASMIKHNILFIGLDTHKTFTEVAYIEDQRGEKSTHLGKILSNKTAFTKRFILAYVGYLNNSSGKKRPIQPVIE